LSSFSWNSSGICDGFRGALCILTNVLHFGWTLIDVVVFGLNLIDVVPF
jgi:hypothetical protein